MGVAFDHPMSSRSKSELPDRHSGPDPASASPVGVAQISAFPRDHIGGSEFYAHQLAWRLANRGHRVSVITSNLGSWRGSHEVWGNVQIDRCPTPWMLWDVNPATWALPALLRSDASIFHVHTHYFLTSVQAALARRLRARRLLLHIHGLDVAGTPDLPGFRNLIRLREEVYDRMVTGWLLDRADAIASVSQRDLAFLEDRYGVSQDRLHWIPNAVEASDFDQPRRDDVRRPVVTFIGRLEPSKGADYLPAIINRLAAESFDFDVEIVGNGSLGPTLKSAFRHYDGHIRLHGAVDHDEIPVILSRARVLLAPSRVEGVPTACLEALAAGVPIVAADVGGTREVVQNGRTGFVHPPGDVDGFARRLRYFLENPEDASAYGREGRRMVERDYTWPSIVSRVESVYADLGA